MRRGAWFPIGVLVATLAALVAAAVVRPAPFAGEGWHVRGVVYPVLQVAAPALWWLGGRRDGPDGGGRRAAPSLAFGLLMLPFLSDVLATWFDLFDTVTWWDDVSHAGHWFLLAAGLALIAAPSLRPSWLLVPLVTGTGALLAVLWELLEYLLLYRDRGGPYEDTLGDLALGTGGALVAAVLVAAVTSVTTVRPVGPDGAAGPRRTVEQHG